MSRFCSRCSTAEKDGVLTELSEVFRNVGVNFDQAAPVVVWEYDDDEPSGRRFYGGFDSRQQARDAVSLEELHLNILTAKLPPAIRPDAIRRKAAVLDTWEICEDDI